MPDRHWKNTSALDFKFITLFYRHCYRNQSGDKVVV